jgi:hypothetical protein
MYYYYYKTEWLSVHRWCLLTMDSQWDSLLLLSISVAWVPQMVQQWDILSGVDLVVVQLVHCLAYRLVVVLLALAWVLGSVHPLAPQLVRR